MQPQGGRFNAPPGGAQQQQMSQQQYNQMVGQQRLQQQQVGQQQLGFARPPTPVMAQYAVQHSPQQPNVIASSPQSNLAMYQQRSPVSAGHLATSTGYQQPQPQQQQRPQQQQSYQHQDHQMQHVLQQQQSPQQMDYQQAQQHQQQSRMYHQQQQHANVINMQQQQQQQQRSVSQMHQMQMANLSPAGVQPQASVQSSASVSHQQPQASAVRSALGFATPSPVGGPLSNQSGSGGPTTSGQVNAAAAAGVAKEILPRSSQLLDVKRLDDLAREVDPHEQLDDEVKDALLQLTDDFVDQVCQAACDVATHRGSSTLEAKDVQFVLQRHFNIFVPGFGGDEIRVGQKRPGETEAHKQRMQTISKTLNKP